jgi:hypothetical protein
MTTVMNSTVTQNKKDVARPARQALKFFGPELKLTAGNTKISNEKIVNASPNKSRALLTRAWADTKAEAVSRITEVQKKGFRISTFIFFNVHH